MPVFTDDQVQSNAYCGGPYRRETGGEIDGDLVAAPCPEVSLMTLSA